jgi:beta-glucanase (GH16 family)
MLRGPAMSRTGRTLLCLVAIASSLAATARQARAAKHHPAAAKPGEPRSFVPPGYACAWHDEFGGAQGRGQPRASVDDAAWTFQELDVNGEAQVYSTKQCLDHADDWNTCVEDGRLRLRARDEAVDCGAARREADGSEADGSDATENPVCAPHFGQHFHKTAHYTSARLMTKHKVHFDGGYIEFRARLPDADRPGPPEPGLWPAVWMLGENIAEGPPPGDVKWPACGEVDIMEWSSKGGASKQGWNALWLGPGGTNACSAWPQGGNAACGPCPDEPTKTGGACVGAVAAGARYQMTGWPGFDHHAWHTYGLEWDNTGDDATDRMIYFIDGVKMGVLHLGAEQGAFKHDMFLTINLALGGTLGGPIQITDWEHAFIDVDYVRWYRKRQNDKSGSNQGQSDACGLDEGAKRP